MHFRGARVEYFNSDTVGTVDDIIRRLFIILEAEDKIPAGDTTMAGWSVKVCTVRLGAAIVKRQARWIVVDDLGLLTSEIRNFCDLLRYRW